MEVNPIRASLRRMAYSVAPRTALEVYLRLKMMREARRLIALREQSKDPRNWIDELLASYFFRPIQKRSEILRLMEIISALQPSTVCEIGAARGGTVFLFADAAAPDARLISIDLAFNESRREAVSRFARCQQKVFCLEGDSHSAATLDSVRECLKGRLLDLLYLDGDHTYEGVATDFKTYTPLVRHGGLIVLHDIVPDYRTRYGKQTPSDTGGVPRFWSELKGKHASTQEIIEDEEQDGFGIGVLTWDGKASTRLAG